MLYSIALSALLVVSRAQVDPCNGECEFASALTGFSFVCNSTGSCEQETCGTSTDCMTGEFTTCLSIAFLGDDGICIDACESDQECKARFNATFGGFIPVDNYYCIDELGVCTEGSSCNDTYDCWEGEVCEGGICREDYCTMDVECDTANNYVCATGILSPDVGVCSAEFCRVGTCEEGSSCITGLGEMYGEGIELPDDLGMCLEGVCETDTQCADMYNASFICVIGVFPFLPETVGICTNDACREGTCGNRGECLVGYFGDDPPPANLTIPDDIGTCFESECTEAGDCGEGEACLSSDIGGICALTCDTAGADCTDSNGWDTTCKLIPAGTDFCNVPAEDTLICRDAEAGEVKQCATPAPTMDDGEDSGAERLLFGVLAVIAGALASM